MRITAFVPAILLGACLVSCGKVKVEDVTGVSVKTTDVTVYYTSAEFSGKVTSPAPLKEIKFFYGTNKSNLSQSSSNVSPSSDGTVLVTVSNLEDGQEYFYQLVAYVGKTPVKGEVKDFVTFVEGPVDLDLPSGKKWASHNLGAKYPTEKGEYYAWGETKPKEVYDWSTYKYCQGDYRTLTKYTTGTANSADKTADKITELERSDDAATANLGSSWHTPTLKEWVELNDNCVVTEKNINGVRGLIIRSKKDQSNNKKFIFIPSNPGICRGNNFEGNRSIYWTASLDDNNDIVGRVVTLSLGYIMTTGSTSYRSDGLPVRAISD